MKKIYGLIDNKLKKNNGTTVEVLNNIIAGVIGGIIIASSIFYFSKYGLGNFVLYSLIIIIVFYLIGLFNIWNILKKANASKRKNYRNYHINLLGSIVSSVYVSILAIFFDNAVYFIIALVSTIFLLFCSILIIFLAIKLNKNK